MSVTRTGNSWISVAWVLVAAARLHIALPPQPVNGSGPEQALQEVVGDARRHLGFLVHMDPERLGFDQAAVASVDADPHLTPAVRGARTPAPHPQHVAELDRADQVDHGAPNDPERMGLLETHLAQLVLADVLHVPAGRVQAEPAGAVDVTHAQRPFAVEHIGVAVGHRHHFFVQAHGRSPLLTPLRRSRVYPGCPMRIMPMTSDKHQPICHANSANQVFTGRYA